MVYTDYEQTSTVNVGVATNNINTISNGQYAAAKLEYQVIKLTI